MSADILPFSSFPEPSDEIVARWPLSRAILTFKSPTFRKNSFLSARIPYQVFIAPLFLPADPQNRPSSINNPPVMLALCLFILCTTLHPINWLSHCAQLIILHRRFLSFAEFLQLTSRNRTLLPVDEPHANRTQHEGGRRLQDQADNRVQVAGGASRSLRIVQDRTLPPDQ